MTDDQHPDDLDRAIRRAAHRSMEAHRASIGRGEIESALQSTQRARSGSPASGTRHRRLVAVSAAAALVALVGALVVVSGDRQTQVSDVPSSSSDVATTIAVATTEVATTPPTSVAPTDVSAPSSAFDLDGNPFGGFTDDEVDEDYSGFVDVLHDYLVNRSDILGDSVVEREQQLAAGGLRIHTTLDPDAQAAAVAAGDELPSNSAGFDAAIVSLDTGTGAVRALVGAPGEDTNSGRVDMAVTPRRTGSAIRSFITAAAVEAGVLADDLIDTTLPCRFPSENPDVDGFEIINGVSGGIEPIRVVMARSLSCGVARLGHTVGLDTVIATTSQLAASVYLDPTGSDPDRPPLEPVPSFATGALELSALDMASGMQTIANEGVHHAPHFVTHIDDADGNRVYTHRSVGNRTLDATRSLETIDILEAAIGENSTGRRAALDGGRPAFGVTGTEMDHANAWFIGATPQLATAVWVGDPAANTPMRAIREFVEAGYGRDVQGGHFPALIWKAFNDIALAGTPPIDWAAPPMPTRPPARLVFPGAECLGDPTSINPPQPIAPQQPVTTVDPATDIAPCE